MGGQEGDSLRCEYQSQNSKAKWEPCGCRLENPWLKVSKLLSEATPCCSPDEAMKSTIGCGKASRRLSKSFGFPIEHHRGALL